MTDPQDHEGFHLANQQDRQTVVAMVCTALADTILYAVVCISVYGCMFCNSQDIEKFAGVSAASPVRFTGTPKP